MGSLILGLMPQRATHAPHVNARSRGSGHLPVTGAGQTCPILWTETRRELPSWLPRVANVGNGCCLHQVTMFYTSRSLRSGFAALLVAATSACSAGDGPDLTQTERSAIADSIKRTVIAAYDLKQPDVVAGMMSLYPKKGPVISAASGGATKTRAELEAQIRSFWDRVGTNMQSPKWEWTSMDFNVLSKTSAVMTATYRVPHRTPRDQPHVIGGAWTAVFQLQNGRWVIVQEHLSDSPTP